MRTALFLATLGLLAGPASALDQPAPAAAGSAPPVVTAPAPSAVTPRGPAPAAPVTPPAAAPAPAAPVEGPAAPDTGTLSKVAVLGNRRVEADAIRAQVPL